MIIIELDELADYTQTVTLEDRSYDLRIQYNPMRTTTGDGSYTLYIGASGLLPALQRKIVTGMNILQGFDHLDGVPPGQLWVVDLEHGFGRITRDGFTPSSGRFQLIYLKPREIISG